MSVLVQPLQLDGSHSDLPAVCRVQAACYLPALVEAGASLADKAHLWPRGCLGAWREHQLVGYLLSHPWRVGDPVPLDARLEQLPPDADCLYLHDLAVDPTARGHGIARVLLRSVIDAARELGLQRAALVAVQDSDPYWARWGFRVQCAFDYAGVPAVYMIREGLPVWRRKAT